MGTRSGDLDPSILTYLERAQGLTPEEVDHLLNEESGLKGLSGLSHDIRELLARAKDHPGARLAIDIFCYVLAKTVAALVVPLGRLDALVFTGGIGENSSNVRARVVGHLGFLGLVLDEAANATHGRGRAGRITTSLRPQALVVNTNEELMIATDTAEIVQNS